jgi:RimJ/RimL family protein N-acetyltransferase
MLGGSPQSPHVRDILRHKPIRYATPENDRWKRILQEEYKDRIFLIHFVDFSAHSLKRSHLEKLVKKIPYGFELRRLDARLSAQLRSDIKNEYFFENFQSIEDFLKRGIGYCILYKRKIVSAATSMAMCGGAIDIEIETSKNFQGQGLGTVVGATLVLYCLENSIEPTWLAANAESERLALKLGYTRIGTYDTFGIKN